MINFLKKIAYSVLIAVAEFSKAAGDRQ